MMMTLFQKSAKTWLSIPEYPLAAILSSAYLRFPLITAVKNILERSNNLVSTENTNNLGNLPDIEVFFNSIQTSKQVYKASLSRQLAIDFSPDSETTLFKDEPKDWFIKTADFGDDCDRVLQHRDGEYTQLLEDIAHYHQIFQQGYDKIILIRPPIYTGYDIQLTAAMQCLGYTKEQFQFIIVQPIKLYAFHEPTQKIHPLPDIPTEELIQSIGMDALRWHSFSTPLTSIASINLSTAGQPTPADSLYRVQAAHAQCCTLLHQAHHRNIIQLNTTQRDQWQITPTPLPLTEYNWDNPLAEKLVHLLQIVPEILQQSAIEIAPHLLIHHLETISDTYHQWSNSLTLTPQNCALLLATKQTIFDLLENIFSITAPEPIKAN